MADPCALADAGLRGVLFDVDGTLVDTTYLHAVCWAEALRQSGHDAVTAVVHRGIGMGSDELLDHILGTGRDRDADARAVEAHLSLYKQFWGRLRPLPGARELLRACASRGLIVVLASSASAEELQELRSTLDVDDAVTAATSSSDAAAGKPNPEIVKAALEAGGLDAHSSLFVGDSVWDGHAARRAGIRFVGLTCGGSAAAELREAGAIEVWHDPAELLSRFDRS